MIHTSVASCSCGGPRRPRPYLLGVQTAGGYLSVWHSLSDEDFLSSCVMLSFVEEFCIVVQLSKRMWFLGLVQSLQRSWADLLAGGSHLSGGWELRET